MYLTRHIEQKLRLISQHFKVVLILGARQVGKSTLLSHVFSNLPHLTFDPVQDLYGARQDPDLFLQNFPAPIILDEVQYVPELLPALKRKVDLSEEKGQYFITGSQNLSVLRNVAESLAGRVGILHLGPMTPFEMQKCANNHWLAAYLRDPENLPTQFAGLLPSTHLYSHLWRGGLPGLIELPDDIVPNYLTAYVQTYIERDIRLLENIRDASEFSNFLGIIAALTAQEMNYSELGREVGLSPLTARRWIDLLIHSYQWSELWPYSNNAIKRISKKRKGLITDTGLACYLQRVSSSLALARHPLLGHLFESFNINIIFRLAESLPLSPKFYHWRTNGGAEVDLLMEQDGCLYPIEFKCKTVVNKHDTRGIRAFRDTYPNLSVSRGLVIYAGEKCYKIDDMAIALPWNSFFV